MRPIKGMGCDTTQKRFLSGAEGTRGSVGALGCPSLMRTVEPLCLSFPRPPHGSDAPLLGTSVDFVGESTQGALGGEGTITATNLVVVVVCFFFFSPTQKVISFWEAPSPN